MKKEYKEFQYSKSLIFNNFEDLNFNISNSFFVVGNSSKP